jgi:hypothetical protein
MSGIEIAGLVLGALPVLIEALKKGQEGWTAFRKIRIQLDDLINCLKEQKWMFKNSAKILLSAAGQDLSGDSEPSELLADNETRVQLERYLRNDADTLGVFDRIMDDYKSSLTAIIGKLEHIGSFSLVCIFSLLTLVAPSHQLSRSSTCDESHFCLKSVALSGRTSRTSASYTSHFRVTRVASSPWAGRTVASDNPLLCVG